MVSEVIFQSKNVKKVKNTNIVKGKLVVKWGVHVYEVVAGYYKCDSNNTCRLTDYDRVATYELCTVKRNTVKCSKKISGSNSDIASDSDIVISPDGNLENENQDSRDSIDGTGDEFGSNINAEADII